MAIHDHEADCYPFMTTTVNSNQAEFNLTTNQDKHYTLTTTHYHCCLLSISLSSTHAHEGAQQAHRRVQTHPGDHNSPIVLKRTVERLTAILLSSIEKNKIMLLSIFRQMKTGWTNTNDIGSDGRYSQSETAVLSVHFCLLFQISCDQLLVWTHEPGHKGRSRAQINWSNCAL